MENIAEGIAVDIDEVLSQTALFWMDIVNNKFGNSENLSSTKLFKKYKLTKNVPGWQSVEINDFLEGMRVSNEFYKDIPVIGNSVEYLNKIDKIIPVSCYLTIRPQVISNGTKKWLKDNGFPDREIIMKPNEIPTKDGNTWKVRILTSLYPNVSGIIDDNPEVADLLLSKNYKGIVFLYGYEKYHTDKIKVVPCKDWEDIFFEIKKMKKKL